MGKQLVAFASWHEMKPGLEGAPRDPRGMLPDSLGELSLLLELSPSTKKKPL